MAFVAVALVVPATALSALCMTRRTSPRLAFAILFVIVISAIAGCVGGQEPALEISNKSPTTAWIRMQALNQAGEEAYVRNLTLAANESKVEPFDLPTGKYRLLSAASGGFEAEATLNVGKDLRILVELTSSELTLVYGTPDG